MVGAGIVAACGECESQVAGSAAADAQCAMAGADGVPWRDPPCEYGPWQTVHGLFRRWQ
ncbi:hypothetical protein GCM10010358_79120 [Streptomyces minutiscleroticus]|uniref:Uncharacterized protein n=1 Tax=Streptomyces minutiscleroticus TaxID=68238 RepID=A0A918P254_9ACTN|nr:hypothetical protein GCM10010358_79120 [Streptomyces minutiscleroticus]